MQDKKLYIILFFILIFNQIFAQIDMDLIKAQEEFRWGVVAYNNGYYNRAILNFERSLALRPTDLLFREWLGRSYYKSGYEDAALNEWDNLIEAGTADNALINFRNIVAERRGLNDELNIQEGWVELIGIEKELFGTLLFDRPTSVRAMHDGTGRYFIVSHVTNEVIGFDANGNQFIRFDGGLDGFNRPFDILVLDNGNYLVSEFEGDRIAVCNPLGYRIASIGSSGYGDGELYGPQFMTKSGDYIYVSDWGNRRIVKFDIEGNFILNFGLPTDQFYGLKGPSGISIRSGLIYVSDHLRNSIEVFDESGNWLRTLVNQGVNSPEGLYFQNDDALLIADGNRILNYNLNNETFRVVTNLEQDDGRILNMDMDDNGNLLLADFNGNRTSLMTPLSSLYSGLFIRTDRIDLSNYPEVVVDISVEDRLGDPFVGLTEQNFLFKEGEQYITQFEMAWAGYLNHNVSVSMLIDGNPALLGLKEDVSTSVKEILTKLDSGDELSLIQGSTNPHLISEPWENPLSKLSESWGGFSGEWAFDNSLRYSASRLVTDRSRRAVVYISSGELPGDSFENYGLIDTAQYLKNNNIVFYIVYMEPGKESDELEYLANFTGGSSYYLYEPLGLGQVIEDLKQRNNGMYTFTFESVAPTDFGRAYIPLSTEINYMKKSGRDELGFFPPLDFSY